MKIYSLEEIKKLSKKGNFSEKNADENADEEENDISKSSFEKDNSIKVENNNFKKVQLEDTEYSLEEFDNAKTKILKYVLYKKRSENEIIKKFENEFDSDLVKAVVSDLKEKGYINDSDYIKRSVNEFMILRNLSLFEIKYKLMSKGINTSDIEDYFSENYETLMEYEKNSAKKIVQKKSTKMDMMEIKRYLMKKGYKNDSIKQALSDL